MSTANPHSSMSSCDSMVAQMLGSIQWRFPAGKGRRGVDLRGWKTRLAEKEPTRTRRTWLCEAEMPEDFAETWLQSDDLNSKLNDTMTRAVP